jgi:nucleoside-diphosphate-sugar epimerase
VRRLVYASTSGVYGDCGDAFIDETRAVANRPPTALAAASMPNSSCAGTAVLSAPA